MEKVINSSSSESSSDVQSPSKPTSSPLQVPEVLYFRKEGKASDSSSKDFKKRSNSKSSKKRAIDTLSSELLQPLPREELEEKGKGKDGPAIVTTDVDVTVGVVTVDIKVDVGGDGDAGSSVSTHVGVGGGSGDGGGGGGGGGVGGDVNSQSGGGVRREEDKEEEFEGWMWKKSPGLVNQYEKRWFLLTTEKKLRYFENEEKAKELGVIDLCQATNPRKASLNYEKIDRPGITFSTKVRTWKLYSNTEEDRDMWFKKIFKTIESIDNHTDNYLYRLIIGVKVSLRDEPNRKLEIDFLDYNRSSIHNIIHPSGSTLVFQEFSPAVFSSIREINGFSQLSLMTEWNISEERLNSTGSSGKSGSIFVLSNEQSYMIKSIEKREERLLLRMVHDYHQHLIKYPDTLLMKVLAFYSLKSTIGKTSFIMFNNLLKLTVSIDEKYDLKGSTKDREASRAELQKVVPCLLDNDFLKAKRKLYFGPEIKKLFMEQLTADALLLSRFDAMDYSLLIAVHKITDKDQELLSTLSSQMFYRSPLGQGVCTVLSSNKQEIYFIGIIDIFTFYDTEKKVAHVAKSVKYTSDSLSTINAQRYCKRFCVFVDSIIE